MNLSVGKRLVLDKAPAPLPDFYVSPTSGSIVVGGNSTFTVTLKGGLDIASISVASSDATKATATITGNTITVTAVAAGNATITVSSSEISKTVPVTIVVQAAPLNPDFTVAPTGGDVVVGANTTFTVTLIDGLQASTLEVVSSDDTKATVSISGTTITVTGVAVGTATITVSSTAISKTQDLVITITVPSTAPNTPPLVNDNNMDLTNTNTLVADNGECVCYDTSNNTTNFNAPSGTNLLVGTARQSPNNTYAGMKLFIGGGGTPKNYGIPYGDTTTLVVGDDIYIKDGIAVPQSVSGSWSLGVKVTEIITPSKQVVFQTSIDLCNFDTLKIFNYVP